MPRQIIEDSRRDNGRILLVSDPHDVSNKDRWFVEAQLRFDDEASARTFFELMQSYKKR